MPKKPYNLPIQIDKYLKDKVCIPKCGVSSCGY